MKLFLVAATMSDDVSGNDDSDNSWDDGVINDMDGVLARGDCTYYVCMLLGSLCLLGSIGRPDVVVCVYCA
jgi:hypothetical protein